MKKSDLVTGTVYALSGAKDPNSYLPVTLLATEAYVRNPQRSLDDHQGNPTYIKVSSLAYPSGRGGYPTLQVRNSWRDRPFTAEEIEKILHDGRYEVGDSIARVILEPARVLRGVYADVNLAMLAEQQERRNRRDAAEDRLTAALDGLEQGAGLDLQREHRWFRAGQVDLTIEEVEQIVLALNKTL